MRSERAKFRVLPWPRHTAHQSLGGRNYDRGPQVYRWIVQTPTRNYVGETETWAYTYSGMIPVFCSARASSRDAQDA
jgi:hypothetical protein